jgi:hypothetical protein
VDHTCLGVQDVIHKGQLHLHHTPHELDVSPKVPDYFLFLRIHLCRRAIRVHLDYRIDYSALADMKQGMSTLQDELVLQVVAVPVLMLNVTMLVMLVACQYLEGALEAAEVGAPERTCPLSILCTPDKEYQDGSQHGEEPVANNVLVEDIYGSQNLHPKAQKVAPPELVVLQGIGGDVVWAAKVQQEEWRPVGNQLVVLW